MTYADSGEQGKVDEFMGRKIVIVSICIIMLVTLVACKKTQNENEVTEQKNRENTEFSQSMSQNVEFVNAGVKLDNLVVKGEDGPYYCNLEENMRWENDNYQVLLCKDPVYDITYYVNYGRDYYIYAMREGKSVLAVKLPGRELYCRNGELYFLLDTYGRYKCEGVTEGDIIKYSPVDGSTECVLSKGASSMVVYPDGICYNILKEKEMYGAEGEEMIVSPKERFYYSFETQEIFAFNKCINVMERWKDYHFSVVTELLPESNLMVQKMREIGYTGDLYSNVRVDLTDKDGNIKFSLTERTSLPVAYWICGDEMYYIENRSEQDIHRSVLISENLQTEKQTDEIMLNYTVSDSEEDFIFFKDTLYFGSFLRVSVKEGSQCYAQYYDKTIDVSGIDSFYTNGEILFCLCNGKLWILEEEKSTPVAVQEFVEGYPLEIGTYLYELHNPEEWGE